MKTTILLTLGIIAALSSTGRPQTPTQLQDEPRLSEKVIGEIPGRLARTYDNRLDFLFSDPTQQRYFIISKTGGHESVIDNGRPNAPYDTIEPIWEGLGLNHRLFFSPNGKRYGYVGRRNGEYYLVVDGKEKTRLLRPTRPHFGPDGRLAYEFERNSTRKANDGSFLTVSRMVVEGLVSSSKEYDSILEPSFSPDGHHFTYFGFDWEKGIQMVLDGREQKWYEGDGFPVVRFSPDGRTFAYFGMSAEYDHKVFLVINGQEHKAEYPDYAANAMEDQLQLAVTNKGRYAYVSSAAAEGTDAEHVIVDGQKGRGYIGGIANLSFSPDGRHVAYMGARTDRNHAVIDGVEGPPYEWISMLQFSRDSKHFAYFASDGKSWFLVLDGKPGKRYSSVFDKSLNFSSDGRRLCFYATKEDGEDVLVVAGANPQEFAAHYTYFDYQAIFSQDSKHIAYIYYRHDSKWALCVDGQELAAYDARPANAGIVFDKSGRLRTIAVRGNEIFSVEVAFSGSNYNPFWD
jgi:hypothetical protein